MMKSKRNDGRGHWQAGKRRSQIPERERKIFLADVRRYAETESIKAAARQLRCSDRAVRRWLSGEDWRPTDRRILRRVIALR